MNYETNPLYVCLLEIKEEIGGLKQSTENIVEADKRRNGEIKELTEAINRLPCQQHESDIKRLLVCNKADKDITIIKGNRKNQLISAAIGGAIGAGATVGIFLLTAMI
jgi:hypothetical protein